MKSLRQSLQGFRTFLDGVVLEMKKTSWPGRQELLESTVVVIVSVLLLSVYVGLADKVLVSLLRVIIPSG